MRGEKCVSMIGNIGGVNNSEVVKARQRQAKGSEGKGWEGEQRSGVCVVVCAVCSLAWSGLVWLVLVLGQLGLSAPAAGPHG